MAEKSTGISSGYLQLDKILNDLPLDLRSHSLRARTKAIELAEAHGCDVFRAGLSALSHDIARLIDPSELYERALNYGISIHPVEQQNKVLLHGPVGAEILRRECGVEDQEIIQAVWWHSTFNSGLGPIAKLTFLADKLDPNKAARFSDMDVKHSMAFKSLDTAILSFIDDDISRMLDMGIQIHPASIEARNWLLNDVDNFREVVTTEPV